MAPTIWFGDTAEFQVIAHLGGLGHTTGYPLYLTLAKPFSYFPAGNPAVNLNFMSVLFGVLALLSVHWLAFIISRSRISSFIGSLIFGCGMTFWLQTSFAEVYTLHIFLLASTLIFILKWHQSGNLKSLQVGLFILALSVGNHLTILLLGPALLILFILNFRSHMKPGTTANLWNLIWPPALGIIFVILLYYLLDATASPYDHLRAIEMMTPESWGKTAADFDSFWKRMWHLITARQFSGSMFDIGWEELRERIMTSLGFVRYNIAPTGILAVLAGWIWLAKKYWKLAVFFAVLGISLVIYNLNYGIWKFDIAVYFIPLWMIAALMISFLMAEILTSKGVAGNRLVRMIVAAFITLAILVPMLAGSDQAAALVEGHPPGKPDPYLAYNSTKPVMEKIEDNAIIFTLWHQFHVIGYILLIEEKRSGIGLHEMFPAGEEYDFFPGYLNYIEANIDLRPIYLTYPAPGLDKHYRYEHHPPLIRLRRYDHR